MIGIGIGLRRQRFSGGFADSYSSRVLADGGTIEALTCVANASTLLQQASLLFIPSGYKAGVAYSALPNNGIGDLTWSRNSTANRTNSNGNIGSVGANVPRLSYMYGSCPALLLEPQRTNLDPLSQTFGGSWVLSNSGGLSASSVSASNPFDFSTVQKLIPSTTLGQHRAFYQANYSSAGKIWAIVKSVGYNFLSFGESGGVTGGGIIFNLSNGTISGTAAGYTGEITPLGNGWYKCSLTMNNTGSISRWIVIRNNNTTADYSGDGTSGILIAHKQMEVGAYDTTAIFTNGATATRLADTFTRDNIYTNGLISASGGTWYVELKNNVSYTRDGLMRIGIGDTSNFTSNSFWLSPNSPSGRYVILKTTSTNNTTLFVTNTDNVKIAIKWNGTTADVFVNGVKEVSATAFTTTLMQFFSNTAMTVPTFIQAMALFNTPLSDSDCQLLTT